MKIKGQTKCQRPGSIMAQLSRQKWFFPMLVEMIGDFYSYMCYTERKIFLLGRRYIWMNLLNF